MRQQDDTIVWVIHAMKGGGAELDVLLRGNAVNYGVRAQDASGLSFGALQQTNPPTLAEDVEKLSEKGVKVYIVEEDLAERGIEPGELVEGLTPIARGAITGLLDDYHHVWHW